MNSNSNSNWNTNYTTWNYKKNKGTTRYSAGILPYSFDNNGKCLFLLGKDNDNDWSDFGGRCEFRDHSDEKLTACREFYEETLGSIMSMQESLDKINNGATKIISKTLNGSPYYMYLVYVDYSNYSETFTKTSNFLKYIYSQEHRNTDKIIEKIAIRWVSIDTLINCIDNKDLITPISLRGVFFKTIQNSKESLLFLKN